MPQLGMALVRILVLVLLPLLLLYGGATPRESMPHFVKTVMLTVPTTHFVAAGQAILFRDLELAVVWPQCLAIVGIGTVLFALSLARFRETIADAASTCRVTSVKQ